MREQEEIFYAALRAKHNKAAILTEVTMPDLHAERLSRAARALSNPRMKRIYDKSGLDYDAEVPDGYNWQDAKLTRRIDFLMFEGQAITAIEMKVSKADFRRDTEDKRRAWKSVVNRFVYLTPKGLLTPEEIPEGCGLWEYDNGVITVVKKCRSNPNPEPFPPTMMKYFAWRAFAAESTRVKSRRRTRHTPRRR